MARKVLRQVKADLTVLSIQPGGELRDQTVCPSPGLVTMRSRLPFLDESAPSILADGLLRASDFLQVDTVRYAETILITTPLCAENSFFRIAWLLRAYNGCYRSCIKRLRIYHARHQPSLSFPRTTNVVHEPSQGRPTLDGFGSRDL